MLRVIKNIFSVRSDHLYKPLIIIALEFYYFKNVLYKQCFDTKSITFHWSPGHIGIFGNEEDAIVLR